MPDKKLTDLEIKKALEICGTYKGKCTDCPAFIKVDRSNCKQVLLGALDIINRQNAENERLRKENKELTYLYEKHINTAFNHIKAEAYKVCLKRFEKNIKDAQVTLGQTWEIQNALKKTYKELVGEDK